MKDWDCEEMSRRMSIYHRCFEVTVQIVILYVVTCSKHGYYSSACLPQPHPAGSKWSKLFSGLNESPIFVQF